MSKTDRPAKWLIWLLPTVWLAGLVGSVSLYLAGCGRIYDDPAFSVLAFNVVVSGAFIALGLLIVVYRPANRIGWLCGVIGVYMMMALEFTGAYSTCALQVPVILPGAAYVAWLNYVGTPLLILLIFSLLPLWFPDGQFVTPRWRRLALAFMTATCAALALAGLLPGPLEHNGVGIVFPIDNPFGLALLPASLSDVVGEAIIFPLRRYRKTPSLPLLNDVVI